MTRTPAARIYRPSKSAMQSGRRNTNQWVLEFEPEEPKLPGLLMGWAGSHDTRSQLRLRFATREEAVAYAERHGIPHQVLPEHPRKPVYKTYAENFLNRRSGTTI